MPRPVEVHTLLLPLPDRQRWYAVRRISMKRRLRGSNQAIGRLKRGNKQAGGRQVGCKDHKALAAALRPFVDKAHFCNYPVSRAMQHMDRQMCPWVVRSFPAPTAPRPPPPHTLQAQPCPTGSPMSAVRRRPPSAGRPPEPPGPQQAQGGVLQQRRKFTIDSPPDVGRPLPACPARPAGRLQAL